MLESTSDALLQSNHAICRGFDKRKKVGSWIVRLRRDGQRIGVRYFYDHHYPTPEAALQAARHYRDALLLLYPPLSSRAFRQRLNKRNTSGVSGVNFDPGRNSGYWMASTRLSDGTLLAKRFSVKLHGQEGAKQLAIAERHRQLQQVDNLKTRDENVARLFQHKEEQAELVATVTSSVG